MDHGKPPGKRPRALPRLHFFLLPRDVTKIAFQQGDPVYVCPKYRHEYTSDCLATFDSYHHHHREGYSDTAWVILEHNGKRRSAPLHRLVPVIKLEPPHPPTDERRIVHILVVHDTTSFRRTAWTQMQHLPKHLGRHVLEIGTSTGETSQILWKMADSWVGLDTSVSMIQAVQDKQKEHTAAQPGHTLLHCERLDALVDPERAKHIACRFHPNGPTDVWLDIGGDRAQEAVWRLLHFLCIGSPFPHLRQVVIKCEEMYDNLRQEILDKNQEKDWVHLTQLQMERDEAWLQDKVNSFGDALAANSMQKLPKHPLKAPMRLSAKDRKTPICRFHNYHGQGCSRNRDNSCPYDHTHCHFCLQTGHVARDCPKAKQAPTDKDASTNEIPDMGQVPHSDATVYGQCVSVGDRYEKLGRLGEGTYGIVYKARDRQTQATVALKRCIPHHEASDGFPVTTLREIQSLRLCQGHPNIVQLEEIAVSRKGVFLVFEYCEHDMANLIDLYFQMHKRSPFSLSATKTLLRHLLEALDFIHSHYIIHRDVKLTNLLYTNRGCLKLADFGLSRPFAAHDSRVLTQNVASLWYRPPELLLGAKTYNQSIDIWAVGCIFAEFLSGQPLINGKTEEEQIRLMVDCIGVPSAREWLEFNNLPKIKSGTVTIPKRSRRTVLDTFSELSKAGLVLQSRLLHYDSHQRWTARECLESPFFSEAPAATKPESMPSFPTV